MSRKRRLDHGTRPVVLDEIQKQSALLDAVKLLAARLGLVVTRGREVESLAPSVWAIPAWRLFGPTA